MIQPTRVSVRVRKTKYANLSESAMNQAINATAVERPVVAPRPAVKKSETKNKPAKKPVKTKGKETEPKRRFKASRPATKKPVMGRKEKKPDTPDPESPEASAPRTPGSAAAPKSSPLSSPPSTGGLDRGGDTIHVLTHGEVKTHTRSATNVVKKPGPKSRGPTVPKDAAKKTESGRVEKTQKGVRLGNRSSDVRPYGKSDQGDSPSYTGLELLFDPDDVKKPNKETTAKKGRKAKKETKTHTKKEMTRQFAKKTSTTKKEPIKKTTHGRVTKPSVKVSPKPKSKKNETTTKANTKAKVKETKPAGTERDDHTEDDGSEDEDPSRLRGVVNDMPDDSSTEEEEESDSHR